MAHIDCVCAPKADGSPRHADGDTVTLRPTLEFRPALAIQNEALLVKTEDPDAPTGEILAALSESYLIFGIESWTLADDKGKRLEVTRPNIRAFMNANPAEAFTIANEAESLYERQVMRPLMRRVSAYLPTTPTTPLTSVPNGSRQGRPKQPKPSSITTSQTDGIERMSASRAGDYS